MSRGEELDPWHKIALGWAQPRVHSLNDGEAGWARLPLAPAPGDERPVLLYDPVRGYSE